MSLRNTIGLGQMSLDPSSQGGKTVSIFSGSVRGGMEVRPQELLLAVGPDEIDQTTTVESQQSIRSFHQTFFEDFKLQVNAVYNFFVKDELINIEQDQSASLADLPRYVELSWRPAPFRNVEIPVSRKGFRPDLNRPSIGPALDISIAKSAVANGYVSPGVVSALLVPPLPDYRPALFDEDGFLLHPTMAGADAATVSTTGSDFMVQPLPIQGVRMRVNFIDPSIVGALDQNRIAVANDHTHLATLGSLAKLTPGLEVISEFNQDVPIRNRPPKFPVTADSPPVMYVGYVIERHTLDQNGAMTLSKTIDIPDPSVSRFIDRSVLYGSTYAYRIRAIVQWAHTSDVGFMGQSTFDRLPAFNISAHAPLKEASFLAGDWSDWSKTTIIDTSPPDPPEELTVMPRSQKRSIRVSWKMPGDPQRDISSIRLLRAKMTPDGISDWSEVLRTAPTNGAYEDRDVTPWEDGHTSYVYAMYSTSVHGEISVLSEQIEGRILRTASRGEWPVRQVQFRGADPRTHASGLSDPHPEPLAARSRVAIYCRTARSDHPLFAKSYVVEVRSLSTGERVEVGLAVDSNDVSRRSVSPTRRTN